MSNEKTADPAIEVANTIYRLSRNYEYRTGCRPHRELALLMHPYTRNDIRKSPALSGHITLNGDQLFGFELITNPAIPEGVVRFVLNEDHPLLADPPMLP